MKHFALQSLIIIIIMISAINCQRWTNYNKASNNNNNNSKQNGRSSAYLADNGNNKATEANIPAKSQQSKSSVRRGIGVGAWGIVAITLTVILSGLGVYYFVIFYPIVCKKERMYDVMEMTTV